MGLSNDKFWSRAMRHSAGSKFTGEYLGEFETEFEHARVLIWGLEVID
jgi:hypothetical protein